MIIREFTYSTIGEQITAFAIDSINNRAWFAYAQDGDGVCLLKCTSAFDLNQTYFRIELEVDDISKLIVGTDYLYVAVSDSTLIGMIYNLSTPLSYSYECTKSESISENPVDVNLIDDEPYFLMPGGISGVDSSLEHYNSTGTFDESIDLSTVNNSVSMTVDSSDNIWIITSNSPSELVRVYDNGGWQIEINDIITGS